MGKPNGGRRMLAWVCSGSGSGTAVGWQGKAEGRQVKVAGMGVEPAMWYGRTNRRNFNKRTSNVYVVNKMNGRVSGGG